MTLDEFFKKFDLISDMPDAVSRMRSLVLRLAVRGRLVPQNPGDEDADCLLRHIAKMQVRRIEEREVPLDNQWHEVPSSWRWVRLGSIGEIVGGGTPRSDNPAYFSDTTGVPWLTPADLNGFSEKRIFRGRRFITPRGLAESSAQLLPEGSVLFSSRAPIGYVAIAGNDLATNQGFKTCVPFIRQTNEYLYYYLLNAAARIDSEASGTTFREVSGKLVGQIPVALPPLAEQKRIVAKVDELMVLCDRLEAQQEERDERHATLARASLSSFADAPTPSNLTFLFHKSYTIAPADLRKSILTLAVQGRLVPQDSVDAPAFRALGRLAERGGNAQVRRSVPAQVTMSDSVDQENLPATWALESTARLLHLGVIRDLKDGNHGANHPKVAEFTETGLPFITAAQVSDNGSIDYDRAYKVSGEALKRLRVGFAEPGDVIYTHKGSVGRVAICTRQCVLTPQTTYYRLNHEVLTSGFLRTFLRSPLFRNQVDSVKRQTTRDFVSINAQYQFFLRVPPIAEQRRIVAKVDQLMALVDELEAQLAASRAAATKLLDAIVGELTA